MARYFAPISLRDFRAKIDEIWDGEEYHLRSLTPKMSEDLDKVEFDMENTSITDAYGWKDDKDLLGYQELDNGMMLLGVNAGGDWETPIYFCIYWDGKKLRGYIPTDGNTWNTINKKALGNDDECDEKFLHKIFPDVDADNGKDLLLLRKDLIVKDIEDRILKKGD